MNTRRIKRTCINLVASNTRFIEVDLAHQCESLYYCRNHLSIFNYRPFFNSIKSIFSGFALE